MRTPWVPFGSVFELQRRQVAVDPSADYQEIGVRSFGRGLFVKDPVTGSDIGSKRVFRVESGDLVVSNVFAWEGAVGVASGLHGGMIGSHRFMTWTPKGDVNVDFARHYFGSELGLTALGAASPGSAGRNRTLSIANLEAVAIPQPPRAEQDRVVNHLMGLERRLARVASPSPHALVPRLPELWDQLLAKHSGSYVTVGELCRNEQVVVHPGDDLRGAKEFVGLEYIQSHTGRRVGGRLISDEQGRKLWFRPGQVIYGYLRPYLNKVWASDGFGLCSVEQFTLTPNPSVDAPVLSLVLRSGRVWKAAKEATNRLQLPRLGLNALMGFRVPDIRGLAWSRIAEESDRLTTFALHADESAARVVGLREALLPAARNEIFNAMR